MTSGNTRQQPLSQDDCECEHKSRQHVDDVGGEGSNEIKADAAAKIDAYSTFFLKTNRHYYVNDVVVGDTIMG